MHRVALKSLFFDRGRLAAALTGVAFATLLMLIQVGIYYGFGASASAVVRAVGGDVWLMSEGAAHIDQGDVLAAGTDLLLRASPCVSRVRPVVVTWAPFREADGTVDSVQLLGVDPSGDPAVPWSMARGLPGALAAPGRVTLDVFDAHVVDAPAGPLGASLEIAGQTVTIAALTRGIRNIGLNPMVFASVETAREVGGLTHGQAHYWVADLREPACAAPLAASLSARPDLEARTTEAFVASTERELLQKSGIGVALGFVALLGFLVALVVVGQTLFSNLREHERELAMLKALGASTAELVGFVAWQAAFLAIVGSAIGTLLTFLTRGFLADIAVSVVLPPGAVAAGVSAILALCALASATSVRAVTRISAAQVLA